MSTYIWALSNLASLTDVGHTHTAASIGDWMWERHANVWSWYIRPLFLLPLAWFAYWRSIWGLVLTVVGLVTSMAWFPAPATPDPKVLEFLAFEQEWLGGDWTPGKLLLALLVPISLAAYCVAFWRRSLGWGLVVLNVMAVEKILWSLVFGDSGDAVVVPALVGLAIGDAVIIVAAQWMRARRAAGARPSMVVSR